MRVFALIFVVVSLLRTATDISAQQDWLWKELADQPEWRFTDPAYLYLIIKHKNCPGDMITWLHPIQNRSNVCMECYMPDHQQQARAFAYELSRETEQGYEVTFQPVDPMQPFARRPLKDKPIKVLFPRKERKTFTLTDELSVVG